MKAASRPFLIVFFGALLGLPLGAIDVGIPILASLEGLAQGTLSLGLEAQVPLGARWAISAGTRGTLVPENNHDLPWEMALDLWATARLYGILPLESGDREGRGPEGIWVGAGPGLRWILPGDRPGKEELYPVLAIGAGWLLDSGGIFYLDPSLGYLMPFGLGKGRFHGGLTLGLRL